jgi:hypothetical protein
MTPGFFHAFDAVRDGLIQAGIGVAARLDRLAVLDIGAKGLSIASVRYGVIRVPMVAGKALVASGPAGRFRGRRRADGAPLLRRVRCMAGRIHRSLLRGQPC